MEGLGSGWCSVLRERDSGVGFVLGPQREIEGEGNDEEMRGFVLGPEREIGAREGLDLGLGAQ